MGPRLTFTDDWLLFADHRPIFVYNYEGAPNKDGSNINGSRGDVRHVDHAWQVEGS